jgi:hypothetical protein
MWTASRKVEGSFVMGIDSRWLLMVAFVVSRVADVPQQWLRQAYGSANGPEESFSSISLALGERKSPTESMRRGELIAVVKA